MAGEGVVWWGGVAVARQERRRWRRGEEAKEKVVLLTIMALRYNRDTSFHERREAKAEISCIAGLMTKCHDMSPPIRTTLAYATLSPPRRFRLLLPGNRWHAGGEYTAPAHCRAIRYTPARSWKRGCRYIDSFIRRLYAAGGCRLRASVRLRPIRARHFSMFFMSRRHAASAPYFMPQQEAKGIEGMMI